MSKRKLRSDFAQARRDTKNISQRLLCRLFESAHIPAAVEKPEGFIGGYAYRVAIDTLKEFDKRALSLVRTVDYWDDQTFSSENMFAIRDSIEPVVKFFYAYDSRPDTNQILPLLFNGVVSGLKEPLMNGLQWGTGSDELQAIVDECRDNLYGTAVVYAEYDFRRRTGYQRALGYD